MKKYYVTMECIAHHTLEIEAESFEDAREKAMNTAIPKDAIEIEESLPIDADCEDGEHKDF